MGTVISIKRRTFIKHWFHKLFNCPTFWSIKPRFKCPECGKTYRCYWDGNDVDGHGTDLCDKYERRNF